MPENLCELPLLTRAVIHLAAPPRWREALLGDLEEIYRHELDAGAGAATASRRILAEAVRSVLGACRPVSRLASTFGRLGGRQRPDQDGPRGERTMAAFSQDLRHAVRSLQRSPGFTLTVAATLALGIGCITAFASLFDAVLLRPLPFERPDRLVQLWAENMERPGGRQNISGPDYADVRGGTGAFEELAIFHTTFSNVLDEGSAPERVPALFISPNFFDALGLEPRLGRVFADADNEQGAPPVVVLDAGYWQQRFGGDREVLGRTIRVDDTDRMVIGVGPEGLHFPRRTDVFIPIISLSGFDVRGVHSNRVVGRLKDGYSRQQAQAELSPIASRLREQFPKSNAQQGFRLDPLHESVVGHTRGQLLLVSVAATFLLLVVCANISSLLLERSTRRQRELATRAALGASRAQLLRAFFAESLVLVALGLLGALLAAAAVKRLLLTYGPELPRHVEPNLDPRTLLFAGAVTTVVGLLFALIPGAGVIGRHVYRRLGVGTVGHRGSSGRRWRSTFVTVQIALAVVLTLGAALLVKSLNNLYAVDLGYERDGVLAVDLEVPTPFISPQWPDTVRFYDQLNAALEATPGVVSAAAAHQHPAKAGWSTSFTIEGEPAPPVGQEPEANFRPVTLGYFETLGIPLLAGRVYDESLRSEPPGRLVVNRAFVRAHLGDVNPAEAIGRRVLRNCWWNREIDAYEIIGVVGDTRFAGRHRAPRPAMYLPHRLDATPMMTVLVRAEPGLDPLALLPPLRELMRELAPEMAVGRAATLEELLGETVARRRFLTFLLSAFAAVTLSLAALGLYGTLAFSTARRTRELGLRMALGARAKHLQNLVLGDALRLTVLGLAVGLTAAFWATRALESLLFGVERGDLSTFATVCGLLGAVAMLAGWLPAWRATRIDPVRALAEE